MKQVDVSLATGIPLRTLQRIEAGLANPRIDDVMILCSYLGMEPDQIFIHPIRRKPWLTKSRYALLR